MSKDNLEMAVYRIGLKSNGDYYRLGLIYGDGTEPTDEQIERLAYCFNALQGIPTESLGEVRDIYIVEKCFNHPELYHAVSWEWGMTNSVAPTISNKLRLLREMRKDGADFGELNALIDSVKE